MVERLGQIFRIGIIVMLTLFVGGASIAQNNKLKITDKNAQKLFAKGEYEKAIYVYRAILVNNSDNTFYSYMMGLCYYELGDNNDLVLSNMGASLVDMGSFQNSSPPDAHYFYAKALHIDKQFDKSIGEFKKYRLFVENDMSYEMMEVRKLFGGEINADNRERYQNALAADPFLNQIKEILGKIDEEIAKIKEEKDVYEAAAPN
ncbi:MAG: hypothetical protein HRT71_08040 [Flavobacteriales bacterium]|nr:hypothetical protein [Flavobacteriales bacterium]